MSADGPVTKDNLPAMLGGMVTAYAMGASAHTFFKMATKLGAERMERIMLTDSEKSLLQVVSLLSARTLEQAAEIARLTEEAKRHVSREDYDKVVQMRNETTRVATDELKAARETIEGMRAERAGLLAELEKSEAARLKRPPSRRRSVRLRKAPAE